MSRAIAQDQHNPRLPKNSLGYTLIELMISVALGIAMMSVAMQYLVGSTASFQATESSGRTQENARFALSIVTDDLRMAGYGTNGTRPGFFFTGACGAFDPCTSDGAGAEADRIAVWFDPPPDDGTETDCTATVIGATLQIANVYYLETNEDGVSSLMCRGFDVVADNWIAAAQPLIDGVDNMQVLYGVSPVPLEEGGTISQYVSADTVANWDNVVSVRFVVLVSTGLEDGNLGTTTRTYELLDEPEEISYTDRFNRRVFSTTVTINNALN